MLNIEYLLFCCNGKGWYYNYYITYFIRGEIYEKIEKLFRSILLCKISAIVFAIILAIDVIVYYSYRVGFVYADEALFNNFYMVLFIPSIFVFPAFVCYLMRLLYEKEKRYNYEYCIDYNCFIGCFVRIGAVVCRQ